MIAEKTRPNKNGAEVVVGTAEETLRAATRIRTTETRGTTSQRSLTSPNSLIRRSKSRLKKDSQGSLLLGLVVSQFLFSYAASDEEYNKSAFADLSRKDHDYYFGSYSQFYIHEEMLKDSIRTRAYQRAIQDNPQDFKDKIVLDIGCGTGILSIFAARAGAKHVYAIENAEIALFAREIIKRNGL